MQQLECGIFGRSAVCRNRCNHQDDSNNRRAHPARPPAGCTARRRPPFPPEVSHGIFPSISCETVHEHFLPPFERVARWGASPGRLGISPLSPLPTGNAGTKMLHVLRTGQSVSRTCSCDPIGITSDGVEDLTRIKGCSTAAHCTVSGQSISCKL